MRMLIPIAGIAAILWLVNLSEWRNAAHSGQMVQIAAMVAPFVLIELIATVYSARKKARKPSRPAYSLSGSGRGRRR